MDLRKEAATIIFSTHRMEQVEEICDQIVLVNQGKKILDGSVKQVKFDNKENIFKVGFNELPLRFENNVFEIVGSKDNFLKVKINEGYKPSDVLQEFLLNKASIISFNEILPSLNDIFIKNVEDTKLARQFEKV